MLFSRRLRSLISLSAVSFRTNPARWAALGLFVSLGALFYAPYLTHLPEGTHAWAQADRLSIAFNFYDFGFNFWTPRTSSYESIGGVTGIEFPLQAYVAALGGLVFGREAIAVIFRLLSVALAVAGFWYLFRIVYERTQNFAAAVVPGAFLLCSPTYAFYAGTFLPDPFSLSLLFIGCYYWLRFFDRGTFRDLLVALGWLTLASLVKTTSALYLVAIIGLTIVWATQQTALLNERQRRLLLLYSGGAVAVIVLFNLHNAGLNEQYRSFQFLATVRPITDADTSHQVWNGIYRYWMLEFATPLMYWLLVGATLVVVIYLRRNLRPPQLPLTLLAAASVLIAVAFFKLMGTQFSVHDYYVICSFGPPAVLGLVLALLTLGQLPGRGRQLATITLAGLALVLLGSGYQRLQHRGSDDYKPFSDYYTHAWMRGGAAQLKRLAVPTTARILLLDDPAPDLGLVYFDRRGITWKPDLPALTQPTLLTHMAADSLNYLVMSPQAYAKLGPQSPALAGAFDVLAEQPAVVLRRRNLAYPW